MGSRDVEILLKARDEASAKVKALEDRLKTLQATNQKALDDVGKLASLGKAVATLGAAEGAMRGIGAISSALSGDWEKAANAVKSIPFGIGSAATAMEDMLAEMLGINEELDKIKEKMAEMRERAREANKQFSMRVNLQKQLENTRRDVRLGATENDIQREKLSILFDEEIQVDALNASVEGLRQTEQLTKDILEIQEKIRERTTQKLIALHKREQEQLEKKAQATQEAEQKKAQTEADAALKRSNTLKDLESQILQAQLRAAGENEKAQIEAIRRRFAVQIEEAKRANDEEKALKLAQLRDLELAAVESTKSEVAKVRQERLSLSVQSARFLQSAPGFREDKGVQAQQQTAKSTAMLVGGQRKQELLLNRLLEKMNFVGIG